MKIIAITALSGPGISVGPNQKADIEPGFALSLIASGHAQADGPNEEPQFPANFPHKVALYAAGIKSPKQAAQAPIAQMHGLGQHIDDEIKAYIASLSQPSVTLPGNTPHLQLLVDNGIFSPQDYAAKTAQQLSMIMEFDQMQEINDFFGLSGDAEQPETKAPQTATNPAATNAENTAIAGAKKSKKQ